MPERRVVITGATGMVGGSALRLCLDSPEISHVTAVGRRTVGLAHPRLRDVEHADFSDCRPLDGALTDCDVALFCLGAYTGAEPDSEFRRITVDYTIGFAEAVRRRSPKAAFCFLSGSGADQSEKSRMSFARYKGAAEKALQAQGFERLHIFRPAYIYPVAPRREPNFSYRVARLLYPVMRLLSANATIRSDDLAFAMVHAGLHGTADHASPILENRDIRNLVDASVEASHQLKGTPQ